MTSSQPSAAPQTQRRRLDSDARRAAIVDAARAAWAGATYAEVSAAQIATHAGASTALVFHYFGSKAGLYAAVVEAELGELSAAQDAALAALPPGVPVRDRVRAALEAYLTHVEARAAQGVPAASVQEPTEALAVRTAAREASLERLRGLLGVGHWARHHHALVGFLGFVDGAAAAWAASGCPDAERHPLMDACLGALEGALGDWRT